MLDEDVRLFFPNVVREKLWKDGKAHLPTMIEEYNKKWGRRKDFVHLEDSEELRTFLNNDTLYFTDYEIVGDNMQRIKYDPFTCEFKTTGRVVVENDLRDFFTDPTCSTEGTRGIIGIMQSYAEQGMLHGYVGNSCPSVLLNEDDNLIHIGCEYDEDGERVGLKNFKDLCSICTDLWWYSIVDLETLKKKSPGLNEEQFTIVDIPAGTWTLTHKYGISETRYHEGLPYATLELQR